ncbi:hypothetical protein HK103_005679 [Boothiomyces macroporosus]|uniref:Uncharacterized protein n=1 Tax=Boothiomyces macroporosus TaxID=261099 RepID=A0AAD5UHN8_9FUNG|nr:hypothetical protein HK103_005679 [Boothiomyces macroporosus]
MNLNFVIVTNDKQEAESIQVQNLDIKPFKTVGQAICWYFCNFYYQYVPRYSIQIDQQPLNPYTPLDGLLADEDCDPKIIVKILRQDCLIIMRDITTGVLDGVFELDDPEFESKYTSSITCKPSFVECCFIGSEMVPLMVSNLDNCTFFHVSEFVFDTNSAILGEFNIDPASFWSADTSYAILQSLIYYRKVEKIEFPVHETKEFLELLGFLITGNTRLRNIILYGVSSSITLDILSNALKGNTSVESIFLQINDRSNDIELCHIKELLYSIVPNPSFQYFYVTKRFQGDDIELQAIFNLLGKSYIRYCGISLNNSMEFLSYFALKSTTVIYPMTVKFMVDEGVLDEENVYNRTGPSELEELGWPLVNSNAESNIRREANLDEIARLLVEIGRKLLLFDLDYTIKLQILESICKQYSSVFKPIILAVLNIETRLTEPRLFNFRRLARICNGNEPANPKTANIDLLQQYDTRYIY